MDEEVLTSILNNLQNFLSMHKERDHFYTVLGLGDEESKTLCEFLQVVSSEVGLYCNSHRHYDDARYREGLREIVHYYPPGTGSNRGIQQHPSTAFQTENQIERSLVSQVVW
jgi:hypothetical protein